MATDFVLMNRRTFGIRTAALCFAAGMMVTPFSLAAEEPLLKIGVLPAAEVHADESIVTGLLEYPQYTRPRVFEGRAVPDVLLGGDHEEIRKWRLARAFERTLEKRPELLELLKGEEPLDRRDET